MSTLPASISTGLIHWRLVVGVIDGEDLDQIPDVITTTGKVIFRASVDYFPIYETLEGPMTMLKGPITGVLDSEGWLCTPHPITGLPMYRGVRLLATDDPDVGVINWTWKVTYLLDSVRGTTFKLAAHDISVPTYIPEIDNYVDLTKAVKVPSSPGYGLPQSEAAVLRAEAIAQDIAEKADNGYFDGLPGLVVVNHGTNPNVPRPLNGLVLWIGTVRPVNAMSYDLWDNS